LLQPSKTYFHFYKKDFLNSQAVRIRVKILKKYRVYTYAWLKYRAVTLDTGTGLKGQSHEKFGEMRARGLSLGHS
jgi:hypothetical protein